MKNFKKLMAVLIAAVMVFTMGISVFAVEPEGEPVQAQAEPGEFTHGDFSTNADGTINVTNLTAGDSISYFQLVEWDATNSNWKLTTTGSSCGVTLDELLNGITEAEASTISSNVAGAGTAMTVSGTGATATVNAGLYFLRAVSADNNTIYNPAFVSSDYYAGGNTVDLGSNIGSSAVLKKSGIPFDKTVNSETDNFVDVKPGDVVPFKVTATIPSYGTSFTNPVFTVEDTLSAGLELEGDITVKYGNSTTTETNDDVTITPKADKSGYTVAFSKAYLTGLAGAQPAVEITYSAKVTTAGENNVTYMDNKAKLTYSNTPLTTSDKEDITRHYTFAIDGNLLGRTGEEGSELIKTGTDANGNILTENHKTYHDETVSALNGAVFKLVGKAGTATAGVEKTATSDSNGRINFDGLDAGEYTLTEESCPDGFVKDSRAFTVTITPTYDTTITDLLVSYVISITAEGYTGGATFSMTNEGGVTTASTIESASNFINNTQGVELPSTGGIGTTIFYIIGGCIVLAAVIFLIIRSKKSSAK